ncbi:hypothetical protein DCCM_3077 [Desulfocucumis palustris]|uniref:Flp pilus assembly protein n=1 Tax=Desulfocucumis palustris TaxID=1898651 RepID=A0A2L2XI99_9FIRM|nr:Flp family type IVb pilin [Desulfocucumis palustris]GBF33966.1 hypothetical protein DCCM_3077 [Desulfocucumis palustris]
MLQELKKLMLDQRGPTLLEYAGLAVLILIAVWAAAKALGGTAGDTFGEIDDKLQER